MLNLHKIQFIDDDHRSNFFKLADSKFIMATEDVEHASAVYILAIPMLYYKFERKRLIDSFETPVDWIWRYLAKYKRDDIEFLSHIDPEDVEVDYDLTNSMVGMGKLALNLWNPRLSIANFASTIDRLDDDNTMAIMEAMRIRAGLV